MTGPLSRAERTEEFKRSYFARQQQTARDNRGGDRGDMEFWLGRTRSMIAAEAKYGRTDVLRAFALLCRLFMAALARRAAGDGRLWDDLMAYAHQVVEKTSPRN